MLPSDVLRDECPCGAQDYRKCALVAPKSPEEALLRSECSWCDPVSALRDAVRLLLNDEAPAG